MIGGCSDHQCSVRRKSTAVVNFLLVRKLIGGEDLTAAKQEQSSVGSNCRNVARLIGCYAVGIVDLINRFSSLESVVHDQCLHAARRSDIVITVRRANDTPYRIGGKPILLIEHVDNLLTDHDRKSVIVRSDPHTSFPVNVKAVYVLDGFVIIDPAELSSVITVQPGIGTYPENTVVGLRYVIGFTARKTVVAAVNALYIIVVIYRFPGRCRLYI